MVSEFARTSPYREAIPTRIALTPIDYVGKRMFDLVFALIVTVLILSWLIPILGLVICLTSRGPAIYMQRRTGLNGRPFWCLKFRTMVYQPGQPFQQAQRGDRRVTRLGAYLRRTNLDEMPQFLNVLMGNMSIVGPRPHAVQHDAQYWKTTNYSDRYLIRPGITGLAQVRGCRGETSDLIKMQHRVRLDLYYIRKTSFGLDARICWLTFKQMVRGNLNAW